MVFHSLSSVLFLRGPPACFSIQHNFTGLVNTEKLTRPRPFSGSQPSGLRSVTWASPASLALLLILGYQEEKAEGSRLLSTDQKEFSSSKVITGF